MFRRKQPNRFKTFYYSHPYFVIFNVLIIYNLILIALAALLMTYLMDGITDENGFTMMVNFDSYMKSGGNNMGGPGGNPYDNNANNNMGNNPYGGGNNGNPYGDNPFSNNNQGGNPYVTGDNQGGNPYATGDNSGGNPYGDMGGNPYDQPK